MKNQVLQILCERIINISDSVQNSLRSPSRRYRSLSDTCSRYNLTPVHVDTPEPDSPLLVVGNSKEWIDKVCALYGKEMHLITKGNPAAYTEYDISIVGENTAGEAKKVLEYLQAAGRTKIAVLGPNRLHFESNYYVPTLLAKAADMGIPMDESSVFWDTGEYGNPENPYSL